MQQKTICFYPSCQKRYNHFLFNLAKLLESNSNIQCVSYKDLSKKEIFNSDIYHINWFDQSKTFLSFLKRLYFLVMLKLKGKKIVWTIHNVTSHTKTPFYNKIIFKLLVIFSDVIHIMSSETIQKIHLEKYQNKIRLIPHGDYFHSYPSTTFDLNECFHLDPKRQIFLFFGVIQPYKNIDVLIKAFDKVFDKEESPVLMICGKAEPLSYESTILELCKANPNIIFQSTFIPDDQLSAYIQNASLMVVPYSYRSSLNSGTIPLAFSYEKTLICPDIACVKDIQKERDCLYTYHYESKDDHIVKLAEKMKEAYQDISTGSIQKKELNAKQYMENNSWVAHKKEWLSLYGVSEC